MGRNPVNRLRHKLILVFLTATLIPTAAVLWMGITLLEHSLGNMATEHLDQLSKSLEKIAREYYQQSCDDLRKDAGSGRLEAQKFLPGVSQNEPAPWRQFWESGATDRFVLSEPDGERLYYLIRRETEVLIFSKTLNGVRMGEIQRQYRRAREQIDALRQRDLRRGYTRALLLLSTVIWLIALASVIYLANRISRPVQDLTAGLHRLAGGDFGIRLDSDRHDEIGSAIQAFNHTAGHLQQSRERLVYLTQIASWQTLGRKMAHELKNSLTPIRLTVEEIVARQPVSDRKFLEEAAQLVVGEVESLERRVRAFSEFAAEPLLKPGPLDVNAVLEERVRFLEVAHPDVHYVIEAAGDLPSAWADGDQVKGILTNLLENAAEAAGPGGTVKATTTKGSGSVIVEVHDSGPGLSEEALRSLFQPTISFKKYGSGLGLSISRKNALLAGGDLLNIAGALGGAGFRLILPVSMPEP